MCWMTLLNKNGPVHVIKLEIMTFHITTSINEVNAILVLHLCFYTHISLHGKEFTENSEQTWLKNWLQERLLLWKQCQCYQQALSCVATSLLQTWVQFIPTNKTTTSEKCMVPEKVTCYTDNMEVKKLSIA